MPWSNIERGLRMVWSGMLMCHLLALALQCLLAAANVLEGPQATYPVYGPIWESEGFQDPLAHLYRQGLTACYWLFALAGLWIRQRSIWLNWAWSLPWLVTTLIGLFTGGWPV
ncbi:hypothetical protein SAMN05216321_10266 [Cupriavidus sp. OV038]|jgi:hypothetical protein|uniref:hypothetical protein n=1 Tax=unclassified Cupriavidus TaxID=2640874 RepID=UPI0008E6FDE3|nr:MULTISPECIES: hypothetical protein [unclassified Cupriavidus]SFB89636.1 hypothetical protein SAMN05216321_10266 [Cupriavidus sp. OV038]SFP00546.1 hypothetical protein SAMN05216322_103550 [Cupriavidus sp. OV096]